MKSQIKKHFLFSVELLARLVGNLLNINVVSPAPHFCVFNVNRLGNVIAGMAPTVVDVRM